MYLKYHYLYMYIGTSTQVYTYSTHIGINIALDPSPHAGKSCGPAPSQDRDARGLVNLLITCSITCSIVNVVLTPMCMHKG